MAIEDVNASGVMRKARNCLRREVDRSNRMSMTEEEKERRRSRQRQLLEKKNANRTGMCQLSYKT
ncbi:hypothetical protein Syun_029225 [Stephania yunnanensis]|uniref:IBB domain-containing protein n=1 Tax=Stephania yunnanensis TaxID=152371 RepID=A0AAP0E562_9MAGN